MSGNSETRDPAEISYTWAILKGAITEDYPEGWGISYWFIWWVADSPLVLHETEPVSLLSWGGGISGGNLRAGDILTQLLIDLSPATTYGYRLHLESGIT